MTVRTTLRCAFAHVAIAARVTPAAKGQTPAPGIPVDRAKAQTRREGRWPRAWPPPLQGCRGGREPATHGPDRASPAVDAPLGVTQPPWRPHNPIAVRSGTLPGRWDRYAPTACDRSVRYGTPAPARRSQGLINPDGRVSGEMWSAGVLPRFLHDIAMAKLKRPANLGEPEDDPPEPGFQGRTTNARRTARRHQA
jgi:hypothetical protein